MLQSIPEALVLATEHHEQGRLELARTIYLQILQAEPNHAVTLQQLGVLEAQLHHVDRAVELIARAIELLPDNPIFCSNLGLILESQGKVEEATNQYRRAAQLRPDSADFQFQLGNGLRAAGHLEQALACYQEAVHLDPEHGGALNNLGNSLRILGRHEDAVRCLESVVHRNCDDYRAWVNLAGAFRKLDLHAESIACYRQVLQVRADDPSAREAKAAAQSCLAHARLFDPLADSNAIASELGRWNDMSNNSAAFTRSSVDRTANRRLRVGYVSANFGDHVVGQNILPLFRQHDHREFSVFCYSNADSDDSINAEFRRLSNYQTIVGADDGDVAARIQHDRIDILIDLSLHTAGNRLGVFARKPAPIQAAFAGYPGSTGLKAMDYRITDPYLEPPGSPNPFTETPMHLSCSFWCFDPLADEPAVGNLPASSRRNITFGCLNNFCKVNDFIMQWWTRLLTMLPESRLILLAAPGQIREQTQRFFVRGGIAPERIEFRGRCARAEYLKLYNEIDLCLDTVPYNGHTTSLDSLFMGVPVVTLVGSTPVGRAGLSQLMNLGLPELIAHSPEQYIQIAACLAQDIPRLTALRAALRERMRKSPLMNAVQFAGDIESLYRQMWRQWCAGQPRRP